jgi:ribonuclease P protein component
MDAGAALTQVGFAISRAVGPAVVRNRVRRRLRHILRDLARSGALPSGKLLVIARPSAAKLSFSDLSLNVTNLVSTAAARAR